MKMTLIISCTLISVLGAATFTWAGEIDSLVCFKKKRTLILYSDGAEYKKYKVSLGKTPVGAKTRKGDNKTPEGRYLIDGKNAKSKFHKNLGINYPNAYDKKLGRTGGLIKIHGLRNGMGWLKKIHRVKDWTAGCIAVTNDEIDEIYKLVKVKTPISIYP
ncbi:MAG: L,D-transpeptidase family protein [Bacteroidetes bacterium]|nr:L,D-transpeptidase family protein [Bacteroidota bacterium]